MTKKNKQDEIVVGVDIGSSKVLVLVAEKNAEELRVLGYGIEKSLGVKQGVVVNIDATIDAIRKAVKEASVTSGCKIAQVSISISGAHINGINSKGRVSIRDGEVSKDDIKRVLDNAKAITLPANQEVLHVLPQSFSIDSKVDVEVPLGMHGDVLEAKVHIVVGESPAIKNLVKSIRQCGLEVGDIVLVSLAASEVALAKDEKELGVCLVDIGGGTTDVSVFINGSIQYTNVLPIGGNIVTDDIVYAVTTSQENAEELKLKHGCALAELIKEDESIEVEHISDSQLRKLSRRTLAEVIEARYDEIFTAVKGDLKHNGYDNLIPAGIVLTGGAAQIEGCHYLAESVFNKQVRLAENKRVSGLDHMVTNPSFSAAIGLLLFNEKDIAKPNNNKTMLDRAKQWLSHF